MSDTKPGGRDRLPEDGEMVVFWEQSKQIPQAGGYVRLGNDGAFYCGAYQVPMSRVVYWITLAEARAAGEMREALVNIEEYWNRDQNGSAMANALWHIIETAQAALALAEGKQ